MYIGTYICVYRHLHLCISTPTFVDIDIYICVYRHLNPQFEEVESRKACTVFSQVRKISSGPQLLHISELLVTFTKFY